MARMSGPCDMSLVESFCLSGFLIYIGFTTSRTIDDVGDAWSLRWKRRITMTILAHFLLDKITRIYFVS